MYVPAHFAVDDAQLHELLAHHGAADLITLTDQGLLATMLPFVFDPGAGPHGALLGHVARNNDQWRVPARGESLVIVRGGADAYISPGWYRSKAEHGRVVPTWNYITAHVYGQLVVHDDPAWVEDLVAAGVPVMAHLGLTPQSVHAFGGYRVQGRGEEGERLVHDAKTLEAAGAFAVVLECVPAPLAARVTESLSIPTIGIGAGPDCDAQVLVWQDMAGLSPRTPKFVRKYADVAGVLRDAATAYARDVVSGAFPAQEESYR